MTRQKKRADNSIESPCISNCCLDDQDICLGCGRHIDEITGWHSASSEQKLAIKERAAARKAQRKIPKGNF